METGQRWPRQEVSCMDATVSCWNSSIAPGIPHVLETTEGFLCVNGEFHHSVRHMHFVRNSSCLEFYARHLRHLCLVVQLLSRVRLFATLRTTACQASSVLRCLLDFSQTHVHCVGDGI